MIRNGGKIFKFVKGGEPDPAASEGKNQVADGITRAELSALLREQSAEAKLRASEINSELKLALLEFREQNKLAAEVNKQIRSEVTLTRSENKTTFRWLAGIFIAGLTAFYWGINNENKTLLSNFQTSFTTGQNFDTAVRKILNDQSKEMTKDAIKEALEEFLASPKGTALTMKQNSPVAAIHRSVTAPEEKSNNGNQSR